ncbi:response regulator [Sandaracinus amylolyticus]|uniref:response regulator n=1 Tax=Sandaracinus amylolyticus TaxID=927083 RepID=UPI0012EEC7AC|nr:response regulator [Sandaracinus amylolyticus]
MSRFSPSVVAPAVLVVDGVPAHVEPLLERLRQVGARPIGTATIAQALAVLGSFHVDVVVTCEGVRSEDALRFLRALRQSSEQPRVPVVLVSGHDAEGGFARDARALGARFVPAPAELDVLIDAVRASLPNVIDAPRARRSDPLLGAHAHAPSSDETSIDHE